MKSPVKVERIVRINTSNTDYAIIREAASSLQWEVTQEANDTESDVYWQDSHLAPETLANLKSFQRINHFPGMYSIARKDHLAKNLNVMKKLFPKDYNFFPPTWVLPKDVASLRGQFNSKRAKTFIVKPEASSQGRGIFLTRKFEDIPDRCVVQRYLHKPFLLDGFKFDLRVYVLISACDPLRVLVYRDGLVRLATKKYCAPIPQNLGKMYMHLTNYAVNKFNSQYSCVAEGFTGHKRSLQEFMNWLNVHGHDSDALWERICDLSVKTVCLVQPLLSHLYRSSQANDPANQICFQIIGLDVFINHKLRPILLEVNHTPSFATETSLDHRIKFGLIQETLQLLGLSKNNRNLYYANYQANLIHRACKGIKEMRQMRAQAKQEVSKQRERTEEQFLGNFVRVFPCRNSKKYEEFMLAARDIWLSNIGFKIKAPKEPEPPSRPPERPPKARVRTAGPHQTRKASTPVIDRSNSDRKIEQLVETSAFVKFSGSFVKPKVFQFSHPKQTK